MLLTSFSFILADPVDIQESQNHKGCIIPFFDQKKAPCATDKEKQSNPKIVKKIEEKPVQKHQERTKHFNEILTNIKAYKERSEKEQNRLNNSLSVTQRKFSNYKEKKRKEIKKLYTQLERNKKKLSKKKKQLLLAQKENKKLREEIRKLKSKLKSKPKPKPKPKPKRLEKKIREKNIEKKIPIPKKIKKIRPRPPVTQTPWIEVVVEDDISIYQLALKYYGDRSKYRDIYSANQHIIGKDLKIYNGMSLIIPIIEQFEEQPMILNQE